MVQSNYSTVVQTTYAPQIRKGIPGMISHETSYDTSTWLVGTAGGIPFGVAVSASGGNPKQALLGGASFIGISVIDITQTQIPIDPISGVEIGADKYPAYVNMAVLTRGRIFVLAQADVSANDAVYYEQTGGTLSNSSSGTAAAGAVTFTTNPADGDTIVLNGTTTTFKTTVSSATTQVQIGATLGQTLMNLAAFINANPATDTQIGKFEAEAYPVSPGGAGEGSGANQVLLGARTVGTAGNSLTVTASTTGATVTALSGGTSAATLITGARWLDTAVAGDVARISLSQQV